MAQRAGAGGAGRGAGRTPGGRPTPRVTETPAKLSVSGRNKEPLGLDRAKRRADAPPLRRRTPDEPPRPTLPEDERPDLPRNVVREIRRILGPGERADDVTLALSIGSAAIEAERLDVALEVLPWARHQAPKVAAVREAYGVALYLAEDFATALSELQAYRRLTGQVDQNHLIADCLRALRRDLDQVVEAAEALAVDDAAPEDRRAEAVIVWAATLADGGDVRAARAVLRRFLERPRDGDEPHDLRVRYLAADLAEQADDEAELVRQLEAITSVDAHFLDAAERLDHLQPHA